RELPGPEAEALATDREQRGPRHDHDCAHNDRQRDALAEQRDGQRGGEERIQVDEGGGDRGADLLDREEPEKASAHGADQAGEDEEEGSPGRHVAEPGEDDRGPEAYRSDDEVDPEPRVWLAAAEALPDEDRSGRRAERAGEREDVHGLWHHGATSILLGGAHEALHHSARRRR